MASKETFGYDALARLTIHNRWVDSCPYSQTYSNFNPFHRPTGRALIYPNGNSKTVTTSFDYEGENSLTAGSSLLIEAVGYNNQGNSNGWTSATSSPPGWATKATKPGPTTTATTPATKAGGGDGDQRYVRLWRTCTPPDGSTICQSVNKDLPVNGQRLDLRYAYDLVGNVTTIRDYTNGNQVESFIYDHLNRLTQAATNYAGEGQYGDTYTYTPIGNINFFDGGSGYSYKT